MQPETALRLSWMNILNKKRYDALSLVYKNAEAILEAMSLETLLELGCKEHSAILAMNRLEECDPRAYQAALKKRGLVLSSIEDDTYPEALRQLPDPPLFIYSRGDLTILQKPCIALVGTRDMSEYGRRVVASLVGPLLQAGMVTVSGLAFGIDAEVAKESLNAGGHTVAVLGHGLGMIHPKANAELAEDIVEGGGLLLSEYPLDIRADLYTFPARNRIIAGLSLGTVVCEAATKSGSLITAELALEYGRDVFAVPGDIFDPHYAGCHEIISRGQAKLISSANDILLELGIVAPSRAPQTSSFTPSSRAEESIYQALTSLPASMDDLLIALTLDAATLSSTLTILELKGVAKNVGSGKWVRA